MKPWALREFRVLGAAVVALDDGGEFAVGGERARNKRANQPEIEYLRARRPSQGLAAREIECDAQVRMGIVRQRELGGIRNRVVDRAVRHRKKYQL